MLKAKKSNLTKKDISKNISLKSGIPSFFLNKIIDDLIIFLMASIKKRTIKIKNFGVFKILDKKERLGRNPKNNKTYIISARKSLSFIANKKLNKKVDNY
jgi:nucleoid DNA-binding protein|tara:strand:+ start:744 stop:1043 length:300 start_codon:yes stop_codon:yes gene_type:complete